jgi:dihydroxyacetone kinase-like protein
MPPISTIDMSLLTDWICRYAEQIAEHKEQLTALDAEIGDADHGINMQRGFEEVRQRLLQGLGGEDLGVFFKSIGMTLLSKVGGASGPLYGTLFLRMGMTAAGKSQLTPAEFAAAMAAGVEGIRQRGSAHPGDKTMVDTLSPAVLALQQALDNDVPLCAALQAAVAAGEAGMKATIPMQAYKGRASYLGPRSIGHQDPGATSAYLLIESAAVTLCRAEQTEG